MAAEEEIKFAKKKTVLIDAHIECLPPHQNCLPWMFGSKVEEGTVEYYALQLERWVDDFQEFIRDHRSQDPVNLSVEREYEDQCSLCGNKW